MDDVYHEYADNVTIYSYPKSDLPVSFEGLHGSHNVRYFYWQVDWEHHLWSVSQYMVQWRCVPKLRQNTY
jgi:hypothetical protein